MPAEAHPAFLRSEISFRIPLVGVLDQAGAITFLLSYVITFRATLERIVFIPDVAGAGAGATQSLDVRKGNASGTILASAVPTLANHVLGGPGVVGAVSAANDEAAKFKDNDTLSITKAAGTVFSAGGGTLKLIFRQRLQARA